MYRKLQRDLVVLFFLSAAIVNLDGQDSLQNLLQTNLPDTTRIDILSELSILYRGINLDTSINYAEQATHLAHTIGDKERYAYRLKDIGIGYYYKGDFVKVLDYWNQSLATFEEIEHLKGISNLLGNIGAVYNSTGDYPKAIDFHLKCLRIAEKNNDDLRRATALQNIGAVYSNMGEFDESQKYYEQALELCESMSYEKCIGIVTMNLSEVFRNQGDLTKAAEQIEESKKIFTALKDPSLPEAMIAAAHLWNEQNRYNQAIEESKIAYEFAKNGDSKVFMQRALITLGEGYNGIGQPSEGKNSFLKALEISKSLGVNVDLEEAYVGLKNAYLMLNDYQNVIKAQDSLLSISKQLFDIDKNENIANLQLEFNIEKRENEIALLNADNELKNQEIEKAEIQRNFFTATSLFLLLLMGGVGYLYRFARKKNKIITEERNKSDQLLLNILPEQTAKELKLKGSVLPKKYDFATVLFTDFVGFTSKAADIDPAVLVKSVDYYFRHFDEIVGRHNLEKIKTIGDAYMCVGGLPEENSSNASDAINAASELLAFVEETQNNPPKGITTFNIRIGIHSGPLVAGVVGTRKFQYDIWGDTVNVASRMETNCEPNQINVSQNVVDRLKDHVPFKYRGEITVKNRGEMKMYYLDNVVSN